jgi:hypothetical protein
MFVCKLADERHYLVKQSACNEGPGEASAYEAIAGMPGLIDGVQSIASHDISVIPFLPDAVTLRDVVLNGQADFFEPIRLVAASLGAVDLRRDLLAQFPARSAPFSFPEPECRQVLDCNPALEELFRIVQDGNVVSREAVEAVDDLPLAPTHGDVKLDNVLLHGTHVVLIDWELFSRAPAGWSIASCVGMLFFAAAITPNDKTPPLRDVFEAAHDVYRCYASMLDREGLPAPAVESFSTMVQVYMLEQIASGAMFKAQLDALDLALLEIVKRIGQSKLYLA